MDEFEKISLEKSLLKIEDDINASIKSVISLNTMLRKLFSVTKQGKLKELNTTLEQIEKIETTLREQVNTIRNKWNFNELEYFTSGAFIKELLNLSKEKGFTLYERDDILYSYPVFIRILANERAVLINKKIERRIRPSVLINHLKDIQKQPPRFNPKIFIEALYKAYQKVLYLKAKGHAQNRRVVPLLDIYEILTLLPGQQKEYSKHEFTRDIHLLNLSGVDTTRTGAKVSFPASTGTKATRKLLSIIDEHGIEKRYYGIAFSID